MTSTGEHNTNVCSTRIEATQPEDWWGTRWVYAPPRPVWLVLARALPPSRVSSGDAPLRVRARGVDISRTLPAELMAWQQTSTGDWFAELTVCLVNRTGSGAHDTMLYAPAAAVTPR